MKVKAAVLGAGSWGTALAHHLALTAADVTLWGRDQEVLRSIENKQLNFRYFPDTPLRAKLSTSTSLQEVVKSCELVVLAVPSSSMRAVAKEVSKSLSKNTLVVSTAKGLESGTQKTMLEVLAEELGAEERICVLGGPSFALEVLQDLPTAVVIAGKQSEHTQRVADIFHAGNFRVYTSNDVIGVELGGAVKNVIALAAGVVDGIGMGNNARAALITRGIAEIQRLVDALGGDKNTVSGLSGLGDLLLTSTGDLSRNRRVGLRLGQGERLEDILSDLGQTAEAVQTAKNLRELAGRHKVSVPIVEQVEAILSGSVSVKEAMKTLLSRERTSEIRSARPEE